MKERQKTKRKFPLTERERATLILTFLESATNLEKVAREVFSQQINGMLPDRWEKYYSEGRHFLFRDELGRRIYVFRPGRWDPDKVRISCLQSAVCSAMLIMCHHCRSVSRRSSVQDTC